jgi:superfamily I DNA and RNA helicase
LAGSGKTIILALKAAYLHAQHPAGRVLLEDLPKEELDRLRQLLATGSANGSA